MNCDEWQSASAIARKMNTLKEILESRVISKKQTSASFSLLSLTNALQPLQILPFGYPTFRRWYSAGYDFPFEGQRITSTLVRVPLKWFLANWLDIHWQKGKM